MPEHSEKGVGKSAVYIYIEATFGTFLGFVLWLILSRITTPDVIGTSSTVLSLATIFAGIVSLGIPSSAARFLGKMVDEQKFGNARDLVKVSLLLTLVAILVGSATILVIKDYWILNNLGTGLTILTIVLIGSFAVDNLLRFVLVSFFEAKKLIIRQILSSVIRVILSIALVLAGSKALGLTAAYSISQIVAVAVAAFFVSMIFKSISHQPEFTKKTSAKCVLTAGLPAWIPTLISSTGAQLGTVVVFGASGATEAGTYFMAFAIFSAIRVIQTSLTTAALPVLSAMSDARKRFTWRIIKMAAIASLPISFSLLFNSKQVLGLLGQDYIGESISLEILLLSIFPTAVYSGVNLLVYSYGNYKQSLIIGIASSVPRVVLYFLAVPIYGSIGAAMSFTGGSVIGLVVSLIIARRIGMIIPWKEASGLFAIPALLALLLYFFQMHYLISIVVVYFISYVVFLRLRIITKDDIQGLVEIFPRWLSIPTSNVLNKVSKKLDPSYES